MAKKTKDIKEELAKEKTDLLADPIKVVMGPPKLGSLFVTDHHHGALAWQNAGYATGICIKRESFTSTFPNDEAKQLKQFEDQLKENNLLRVVDEGGSATTWIICRRL